MILKNPLAKKKRVFATQEEHAYWIKQIRAGNDVDQYFDKIIVDIRPYFTVMARSFACSIGSGEYDDLLQEGYLLVWKIIQTRDFNIFFPYVKRAFYYELVKRYHAHMRSKLELYHYLLEEEMCLPWDKGYTQQLIEYQDRRKEKKRQQYLKAKEREEERRKRKAKNHEKYLRRREQQIEYRKANREKISEYSRTYYRKNKERLYAVGLKWRRKHKKKVREYARKYRNEHPERFAETQRKYRESHPNEVRDNKRRYREMHPRPIKKPGGRSRAPYGYRKGRREIWILDRKKASVVRLIFRMYLAGNPPSKIKELLEEKSIPSPSGKKVWYQSTLQKILDDERYTGKMIIRPNTTFGKGLNEEIVLENYLPVIVSEEIFCAVRVKRKRKHTGRNKLKE